MEPLVIGVDAGGTATRAVVTKLSGEVLGRGAAGPGNPVAAPATAPSALAAAVTAALGGLPAAAVVAGAAGIAGHGALADPSVRSRVESSWRGAGLECPLWTVGDVVVAFAAGSSSPTGTVLIAGTGAVAARIDDAEIVRVADGLGWLLGDEGSGFWLGLSAVRATARAMQAGRPLTALGRVVRDGAGSCDDLVVRAYAAPRSSIAALAPRVVDAAVSGDPDAARICRIAAGRLLATLASVDPSGAPIVLAGGVLVARSPITERLSEAVARRWGAPPSLAGPTDEAAARLAARRHLGQRS